jgi:hypothetical protein
VSIWDIATIGAEFAAKGIRTCPEHRRRHGKFSRLSNRVWCCLSAASREIQLSAASREIQTTLIFGGDKSTVLRTRKMMILKLHFNFGHENAIYIAFCPAPVIRRSATA